MDCRLAFACGILTAVTLFARPPPVKTDPTYVIDTWDIKDGMPEDSATAMVQDRGGYLWFGTFGGLVRFDGLSFTSFDPFNTPQLPSDGIINLHLDRDGRLWVSTTKGLVIHDNSGWHAVEGWGQNMVRTFTERNNGDLLLTTLDGLLRVSSNGHLRQLPLPPGQPGRSYFGYVDGAGRWWAVRYDFVGSWDGKQWRASTEMEPADACCGARDGGMWLLGDQSLRKYEQGHEVSRFELPEAPGTLWSMSEDREGNVWIATVNKGICRISRTGEFRRWTTSNGLTSNATRFVFEDTEGDQWIGTSGGGLQRFKTPRVQSIGVADGLPEPVVHSVCSTADGSLLLGTYGGGLVRYRDGMCETIPLPGWDGAYLQSVLADRAGRV
jgi:ligand-binding sensor domain-containing protein